MNGRVTETHLRQWFDRVTDSAFETELHQKLVRFLAQFGKAPRKQIRFMVAHGDLPPAVDATGTTALLDLLTAVATQLPPEQRALLRRRLA